MATDAKKGRASLVEIQTWWKVPSIAHFCSLFRTKFGLPDFEIEELEEALITDTEEDPSYFLKNLLARILFGCYGKRDIGVTTYDRYLRDIMKNRWEIEESRVNPLNIEDTTYHSLPTLSKVEVLHSLCDYRLDAEDVSELLKGTIAEHMRIEPLGSDSEGAKYWYFYGTRLYKEAKKLTKSEKDELRKKREKEKRKRRREKAKERAKEKDKLKMIKMVKKNADHQAAAEDSQNDSCTEEQGQETPTTSTTVSSESDSDDDLEPPRWHIVCNTMEDWEELATKFKKTKSKNEKELYRALANDFLPVMVDLYNQKEKALRKKLLEMAPRRTSGRIQEKKQNVVEDEYEEFIIGEENEEEEEDKFATNERRQRNRQYRKEMQEFEEQEAIKRKEEEEERAKLAKEDRARRVQLREERAQLIAEGKPIPRELKNPSPVPISSRPKRAKKMLKSSCEQNRDEEFDALYISMHKVLDALKRDTNSWPFLEPVSEEVAPKYYEFIKKPMDISTMEQNLDNKKYQTKLEFVDDVHLMFENCETYNGTESEYTEMAQALEVVFTRMMLKCFPEDDMDFLEDDFFMSEQCKPRRSGRTVKDTLADDENVFGSFREDDSSDENQSEDDCYHPTNKKMKMNSPVSKRPQRVPRVNYTGDDLKDDSKDGMRRVHAFRNFYSNRASFNADPMYGVTCSHMSVMRVVDGKIIEERGPAVRPTSQTALPAKDVKNLSDDGENKDNEKPSTVGIPVPSSSGLDATQEDTELVKKEDPFKTDKTQNNEQLKSDDKIVNKVKSVRRGRIAKKEKSPKTVDTEDGIKNNLSSFMKHPKVRSKKERLKEAETVPVVSLPQTIFTPTSVSKAVPALLSKGNHLKQEMKMIAVDGGKVKNEDKLLSTSLFKYNGPKSPKQMNVDFDRNMSPSHNIKHRQKSSPGQRLKSSPEKVAELGVKKGVKQRLKSTLNFDSTLQNHSISGSTKVNYESSDVSTILPINSDQLNYSKNEALHPVDGSGDQIRTFSSGKQESQTMIQERASVITFLPNSVPQSAGDASSRNIASDLKIQLDNQKQSPSATCSQYNVKYTQEENSNDKSDRSDQKVCNAKTLEAKGTNDILQSDSEEIYNKTDTPSISSNQEPLLPIASGPHGHTEMYKPPILQAEISNTLLPTDQQIVYTPPNLEAQISNTLLHKQEVYTSQNLEAQISNTLPNADQQEVCAPQNLEAQPPKSNHQEVYTLPILKVSPSSYSQQEVFTPSNLETPPSSNLEAPPPKSDYQEVYPAPNLEAQPSNSDLKDLIDIDALQEKNSRPAPVNPRPTASPTPLLPLNSNKTFNTTSLMMNRVLLPNSLTINHMDSLQAHNSFNQFKGMPTTYQPSQHVHGDQRYLPHASGTLQHSTATLQQPITMVQGVDTQKAGIRQQYTAHQYPQATTSNLLQFSDAMQPYQQLSQPYADANQHHPGTHSTVAGLQQQQKAPPINPGASHRSGMPQHTLSLPQSSIHQQPVLSNVPVGQNLQQQSAPDHNWDHRQQSYQTQPVFQVGAQANVSMPQTYQMSIPGHPSLQNGSYPPT
ncbi:uncharacterized protein [Antedon mediterranea]|uniref:uncharacterized protein isoform X2 n=1 Tax=Antedon mediterranea TaxID=105859 RepID=UPI003AF63561